MPLDSQLWLRILFLQQTAKLNCKKCNSISAFKKPIPNRCFSADCTFYRGILIFKFTAGVAFAVYDISHQSFHLSKTILFQKKRKLTDRPVTDGYKQLARHNIDAFSRWKQAPKLYEILQWSPRRNLNPLQFINTFQFAWAK